MALVMSAPPVPVLIPILSLTLATPWVINMFNGYQAADDQTKTVAVASVA